MTELSHFSACVESQLHSFLCSMGAGCSPRSASTTTERKNTSESRTCDNAVNLSQLFPEIQDKSFHNQLDCNENEIVNQILSWGKNDEIHLNRKIKISDTFTVLPRGGYDVVMRTRLLQRSSLTSNILTLKMVATLAIKARAAKDIIRQRHLVNGCETQGVDISDDCQITNDITATTPTSHDDKVLDGLQLMKERLQFLKLRMIEMDDDGNCQFRAISYELYGTQSLHLYVRRKIIDHMKEKCHSFSLYVGDEEEWYEYLQQMSLDQTWGDELTVCAAAQVFNVNVHVITSEASNWLLCYKNDVEISRRNCDSDDLPLKRDVFLMYLSPIHYNVVAPSLDR